MYKDNELVGYDGRGMKIVGVFWLSNKGIFPMVSTQCFVPVFHISFL